MSDMEKVIQDRIQNFKNVITGKGKVDHIPHFGNYWSWKYYDAGYKLSEALNDYSKMKAAIDAFAAKYEMDIYYETGWRNPIQVTGVLGNSNDYIINDENYSLSIRDQAYMDDEDYEKLIANPQKYLWEDFAPKKFSVLKNHENSVDFREFISKYLEFGGTMGEIGQIVASHGGVPFFDPDGPAVNFMCGYELLFNNIRGMRKLSMDLRRRPEQVAAAVEALDEYWSIPRLKRCYQQPKGTNPNYCVDTNPVMLGHVLLSPKQFEKFYWPHLERVAKCAEEMDKLVYLFVEGSSKRFWDFFRELPENRCVFHGELDDIFEAKEALPNCVMAGGMPVSLLGRGTPEECVDYTKELIDRIGGEDHRYIFATEKMISFPQDCKSENLKAICDYLNSIKY